MDYEKKYKEALERAKQLLRTSVAFDRFTIEKIFPELKESEDEKKRKEIISFLKSPFVNENITDEKVAPWIEWLEKQGEPTEINPSEFDLRLNRLLKQFDSLPKEELASSLSFYLNVVQNNGSYKEEKQGEQKPNKGKSALEAAKEEKVDNQNCVKPADKDEPKFHEGEWVVISTSGGEKVVQIDSIEHFKRGEPIYITSEGRWFGNGTKAHLWTIQDAKDGDILYSLDSKQPFIYKNRKPFNQAEAYCGINIFGKFFVWNTKDCAITLDKYVPATKEQRELLFKKMHEAGYEWGAEMKELMKIEDICMYSTDDYTDKERETLCEGCTASCKYNHNAWSEEDEEKAAKLKEFIAQCKGFNKANREKAFNMIDAIKPKPHWKPSDEQIIALRWVLNNIPYNKHKEEISGLLDQIKDL